MLGRRRSLGLLARLISRWEPLERRTALPARGLAPTLLLALLVRWLQA